MAESAPIKQHSTSCWKCSGPKSKIFIKAFSIFRSVILSITKKDTSSTLASFTCRKAVGAGTLKDVHRSKVLRSLEAFSTT